MRVWQGRSYRRKWVTAVTKVYTKYVQRMAILAMLGSNEGPPQFYECLLLVWACMRWLFPQAAMLPILLVFSVLSHDIWIRRRPGGWLDVYFSVTAGWEFPLLGVISRTDGGGCAEYDSRTAHLWVAPTRNYEKSCLVLTLAPRARARTSQR